MLPRARTLGAGVVLTLVASLPAVSAVGAGTDRSPAHAPAALAKDPRLTRGLFVDPDMPAARAAAHNDVFAPIGRTAQALWITDYYATDQVKAAVAAYTKDANDADKTPVMSIYAIPGRDCGLYSAGGLPDAPSYKAWVKQAAAGMKDQHAMVVLEPDAVPFMGNPECDADKIAERSGLLRFATRTFTDAGAWVYIDAGHSGWRTPEDIARLLKASGIALARGFSTNVGNYRKSPDEIAYAKAVVGELKKLGITGKRYVTETARNGAPRADIVDGDVCNPTWARIGRKPRLLFTHDAAYGPLDGYVWVKHPGESDGQSSDDTCHGGPPSGEWWPKGAKRLLGKG
ncbi:glycoside hydrolase family 6 protein [Nocardioides sp. LS1]|uniref:glycoside hydrolase family 6 protein n=1 Tax=Nocardioides sp. LS1 TaxID=1027620 RepID=UPI000FFAE5B2|nr:glycoside hydrolase family 6 protein [Nocardioides sp. LS1]GCD90284.1 glucanase [Nocardioides sp. LS1]